MTYIKNRRIGSTYPSINEKPESKVKKTLRKIREALIQKCIDMMKPLVRPQPTTGWIDIELKGMSSIFPPFFCEACEFRASVNSIKFKYSFCQPFSISFVFHCLFSSNRVISRAFFSNFLSFFSLSLSLSPSLLSLSLYPNHYHSFRRSIDEMRVNAGN